MIQITPNVMAKEKTEKSNKSTLAQQVLVTPKQQMAANSDALRSLMTALYEQHSEALTKSTKVGPREMTEWVFDGKNNWKFDALRNQQGNDALALLFDENYQGDVVLALVVGLETLLFKAYGGSNEFELPKEVNAALLTQAICDIASFKQQILNPTAQSNGNGQSAVFFANVKTAELVQLTLSQITAHIEMNKGLILECKKTMI
ncbi:MAG TPA: hypothetical protein PLT61_00510 [Acinetobacter johnsonii]|nr:hypothetical protein [Acinetobacter johnsonii]